MNDLIPINTTDPERITVSARDLHAALDVGTRFNDWFARMCEYGFEEGKDYYSFLSNRADDLPGKPRTDAELTIDMAKEICMIQRNEKGKIARRYFVELEKAWNSPEKVMARALQIANKKLQALEAQAEADKPKVLFADSVASSQTSILVGELAKLLRQNGVDIGGTRLFRWLRENGYLIRRSGSDYNMPTQRSMELGLFKIKETAITHADGTVTVSKTVKVTPKAQIYFVNKFLGEVNVGRRI